MDVDTFVEEFLKRLRLSRVKIDNVRFELTQITTSGDKLEKFFKALVLIAYVREQAEVYLHHIDNPLVAYLLDDITFDKIITELKEIITRLINLAELSTSRLIDRLSNLTMLDKFMIQHYIRFIEKLRQRQHEAQQQQATVMLQPSGEDTGVLPEYI